MKGISAGVGFAIAFWVTYGAVSAFLLYRATEGVQRDLLLVIGGFGLTVMIAMGVWTALRRSGEGKKEQ